MATVSYIRDKEGTSTKSMVARGYKITWDKRENLPSMYCSIQDTIFCDQKH